MICGPDFIKVYNETFKFIDEHLSAQRLCDYWERIASLTLYDLKKLAADKGLIGCLEYWAKTLRAEKANCRIEYDTYENVLRLIMYTCPSLTILKDPSPRYCEHCSVMYKYILEALGLKYEITYNGKGQCTITVSE